MENNSENKYICKYCERSFKRKSDLSLHINIKHLKITKRRIAKKECPYCSKFTITGKYNIHIKNCKQDHTNYHCEKCGKLVTKKFGSGKFCSRKCANSHIQTNEQNKRRSETLRNTIQCLKDKNIWYTEKRILNNKRQGIIGKIHYNDNPKYCKVCGNKLPYELRYRKCCSDICRAKSRGGYRRSKIFLYKGIKLQSSFELQVAKELDFYNIKWIRPKAFIYNYIKIRKYTP